MCILLIFWLSLNQKDAPLEKLRKSTKHVMLILKIIKLKANSSLRVTPWETSYQQKNEMKEKFVTT
ncbi:hypothetical protein CWC25_14320 [Pseudoalteromonas sp. S4389]|jgi:hypothetical protein|nr:hypothetical protein CWC25_14320 [Pseudoalteromonas sp. S4389]